MRLITSELIDDLYGYLGGIFKNQSGVLLAVGGIEDHVHLLVGLSASHRLDHFMRELKASSSRWVRRGRDPKFARQNGYGAFAVSAGNIEKDKSYIRNQAEHHKVRDFKSEYVELLKMVNVSNDEKYLW